MSLNVAIPEREAKYQQLTLGNAANPMDPVVIIPNDVLTCVFSYLNAHDFNNLRLVCTQWHAVVVAPDFAKAAHWYPQLALLSKQLSAHISAETFGPVHEALQQIIQSPAKHHFAGYRETLVLTLARLPEAELKRLASIDLPLPREYRNILEQALQIYYSRGERSWAPWKHVVSEENAAAIFERTGTHLPVGETFVTFRVYGAGRSSIINFYPNTFCSEADKTIPEMFPVSFLAGKVEGEIVDFKLIDGRRFLHTLDGKHQQRFEDTLEAVGGFDQREFSPTLLGHVLLPNLLDQLKVSTALIAAKLLVEVDPIKYPAFRVSLEAFHEEIKSKQEMPDLHVLRGALKGLLQTIAKEDLAGIRALQPGTDQNHLALEDVVRIPEGWETIIPEILAEQSV